ncbi:MAG: hypothetical protein LBJ41_05840 [Treponema sp.]|jgi:hypothetical protein|nr:hypothetical protein [Treponema sp.]
MNKEVEVRVTAKDSRSLYTIVVTTRDPRQVWNKIRIGRNAIGTENITAVHLIDEDPHPFRVGNEKDTVEWLQKRFNGEK